MIFHRTASLALRALPCALLALTASAQTKPAITLDEYLNGTAIREAHLAPDGKAAVIATRSADWQHDRFRSDLWLWRETTGTAAPLTQSGHDESPLWSPDGKYIAFTSDRPLAVDKDKDAPGRVWIISVNGGEAFPLYREPLDSHAYAWAHDSESVLVSVAEPLSKEKEDERKKEWKDVIRWREQERGDVLLRIPVAKAIAAAKAVPNAGDTSSDVAPSAVPLPKDAAAVAHSPVLIRDIQVAPSGDRVVFATGSISHHVDTPKDFELFLVEGQAGEPRQITHNEGEEDHVRWSPDGKRIYFALGSGSAEGKYRDVESRIYALDPDSGHLERVGSSFPYSLSEFAFAPDGTLIATGLKGTETQLYRVEGANATRLDGTPGTYESIDTVPGSRRALLLHSGIDQPVELFLADDAAHPRAAKAITSFNHLYTERAQPEWRTYTWKADDGATIEGVLLYPPGKLNQKNLRMLTLIHGGPGDADGDRFGADWYDWAALAATRGWLVFRPNYRGSRGYGDDFMLQISPHIVSRPGKDILEGVDALVKDGTADSGHLAIGGYSYGGYMTNWLITQTTRFKVALTGAGAVEHAANWGNDDVSYDDAWMLGGTPWENPAVYQSEAALFQFDKVKTPTHLVAGNADVRVAYLEGVTLEQSLERLNIPHTFLLFPGEGHGLGKNPWHGYIKLRDELAWLDKYGAQ